MSTPTDRRYQAIGAEIAAAFHHQAFGAQAGVTEKEDAPALPVEAVNRHALVRQGMPIEGIGLMEDLQ